ncbi:DUF4249 domain-containing protein [Spirosoma validum]|uniref:DUF4249 domain-containing protein n=1 Tax=Spirosoma validum TaxID=2771355 RepID=A0A927B2P0_9BACT|nr:DUF4249 domain-containing protein [Spirosoma validum]MBD2754231.1 DUF4249 domain-containing protein [Spirosoma validum]
MERHLHYRILLLFVVGLYACVDTYDAHLQLNSNLMVMNGIITDLAEPQTITISRSRPNADSSATTPVTKASVNLIVNGTTTIPLSETQSGTYQLPGDFKGQIGNTYQLRFQTSDGITYESSVETMVAVPPISRAYDQLSTKSATLAVDIGDTTVPASEVYIDYQDPPGQANFYLWRWREYEPQDWCASCLHGRYVVQDVGPVGNGEIKVLGCVNDTAMRSYSLYDYVCRTQCWDILYSTSINVFSDVYTNGKPQFGHKIAFLPIYQRNPALIVIEQLSLSANAYRYYKLFAEQTQNTGTLADSPPAPISGNIKNLANPQENVVGYFSAASVATYRHKITRDNLPFNKFIGLFRGLSHRRPRPESKDERINRGGIFGYTVPSAICIPSRTRTDIPPEGL